jgi:hypothetical protein
MTCSGLLITGSSQTGLQTIGLLGSLLIQFSAGREKMMTIGSSIGRLRNGDGTGGENLMLRPQISLSTCMLIRRLVKFSRKMNRLSEVRMVLPGQGHFKKLTGLSV